MRSLMRRDLRDDRGSLILALLGIIILTTVASVGLTAVVNGQKQTRHDNTFTQALDNANSGLDAMVAMIKNNGPSENSNQTLTNTSLYKNVKAVPTFTNDITGNPSSTRWAITATGVSTVQGHTISRTVTEVVTIAHTYRTPVYGANGLALGQGSSISDYNAGANTTPDTVNGLLGGLLTTTVPIPNGTPGAATVGPCTTAADGTSTGTGCLQVAGSDSQGFSQIVEDSNPAAGSPTDTCTAPSGSTSTPASACGTSMVVASTSPPPTITTPCDGATTVGLDGFPIVSVPTPFLQLGLNLEPGNLFSSPVDLCSQVGVDIPSLSTLLAGLPLTTLLALPGFPLTSCITTLLSGGSLAQQNCTPPATPLLGLYVTNGSPINIGSACTNVGASNQSCPPTIVSAIVADEGGNCQINGNVTLFGALNCNTITFTPGATLTVEYPNSLSTYDEVSHVDYVDNWNEQHG
ncbi:MAG TPA: hypothetical protein VHW74_03620 [Mycobacteriales bacterium]|jgi:Tfp pilus assembly protein PilX|nr:hypothetical protein [Mycobacteriales bacterium]